MKKIIEQLNSLQVGDLVWWSDKDGILIGIVTQLTDELNGDYFWRAEFPQDGEHLYWNEQMEEYVEHGRLGVVCKSEI
jgi:hypothetical protein